MGLAALLRGGGGGGGGKTAVSTSSSDHGSVEIMNFFIVYLLEHGRTRNHHLFDSVGIHFRVGYSRGVGHVPR